MTKPAKHLARATVVAAEVSTDYVVTGAGRTLLLLTASAPDDDAVLALGRDFRVIAAAVPTQLPDRDSPARGVVGEELPFGAFVRWVDGLIEGLGVDVVHLVADTRLERWVDAYVDRSPDRVCRHLVRDFSRALDLDGLRASLGA